jgi:hypothetical protein
VARKAVPSRHGRAMPRTLRAPKAPKARTPKRHASGRTSGKGITVLTPWRF